MENTRKGSQVGVGVSALKYSPTFTPALVPDYSHSPELEVSSSAKIRGQLLDEKGVQAGRGGKVAAQKPGLGPLFHTRIAPGSGRQLSGPE